MERWKSSHRLRHNSLWICCCVSTSRDEGVFQLSQPYTDYGRATVESFEDAAKKCVITQGLVKYGLEKEVTVLGSKCSCETFSRLKLCAHVMAVAKYQGPSSVQRLITSSNKPNTSSQIRPSSNAGKKLSSVSVRKGGRSSTNQTKNSTLPDTDVYEIVRGTSLS